MGINLFLKVIMSRINRTLKSMHVNVDVTNMNVGIISDCR